MRPRTSARRSGRARREFGDLGRNCSTSADWMSTKKKFGARCRQGAADLARRFRSDRGERDESVSPGRATGRPRPSARPGDGCCRSPAAACSERTRGRRAAPQRIAMATRRRITKATPFATRNTPATRLSLDMTSASAAIAAARPSAAPAIGPAHAKAPRPFVGTEQRRRRDVARAPERQDREGERGEIAEERTEEERAG